MNAKCINYSQYITSLVEKIPDDPNLTNEKIFEDINILHAFWILHVPHQRLKLKLPQEKLDTLQKGVYRKFASTINNDYEKTIDDIMDYIVRNYDDIIKNEKECNESNSVLLNIIKNEKDCKESNPALVNIIKITRKVRKILKDMEEKATLIEYYEYFNDIHLFDKTLSEIIQLIEPSISRPINNSTNKLTEDELLCKINWLDSCKKLIKECKSFRDTISMLFNKTQKTYTFNNNTILNEHLLSLLIKLRYGSSVSQNLEICSMLMFINLDSDLYLDIYDDFPNAEIILTKYEFFFQDMYDKLKECYPDIDSILFPPLDNSLEHICNEFPGGYCTHPQNNKLNFFMLHKLIVQYEFFLKARNINPISEEKKLIFSFSKILKSSSLPFWEYTAIFNNLPEHIMNLFNLNQKDIAKLLGINEKTISRQKDNTAFYNKYIWFWSAISGYTLEYLCGETTIPFYGSNESDILSLGYRFHPITIAAHNEIFITKILELASIRHELGANKNKRFIISEPLLKKLNQPILSLVDVLRNARFKIDQSYENNNQTNANNIVEDIIKELNNCTANINKIIQKK